MASNNAPLLTGKPNIGQGVWLPATTANTDSDGTGTIGTDMLKIFEADATYGSIVNKIRLCPQASTAATATTATVARFYLSSVTSGATTNADTTLIGEMACPAQTADQTTNATVPLEFSLGFAIPAGYTILMSMHHAAAANTSWGAVCIGGDFVKV
jgi:hypothetical protein